MGELTLSQINVPITLTIKEIEATINDQIDGILYENSDLTEDNDKDIEIRAEKIEDISVSFENNHINYQIPLKVWVKKIIPITLVEVEVEGTIALSLSTEFKIEDDWKLITQTDIIEHEWLEKPQLRIGLFDLPIKFILNIVLTKGKSLICKSLDEELAKNFDLRSIVQEAWKTTQSPILVAEEFGVWLNIRPEKVGMTPLISDGEVIKCTIMVHTYANAVVGEKPEQLPSLPLPSFKMLSSIKDEFTLHLESEVTFSEAEKIAAKYIVGKSFSKGIFKLKIVDLKLFGVDGKIGIEAQLKGTYNGKIKFEGIPVFDPETKEVEVKGVEYQIVTINLLFRFLNWLFKGIIQKRLKKHLHFPLTENLNELMKELQKVLENHELVDGVILNGNLYKFEVVNIGLEEKSLKITINASGKLNLHVNKIEIKKELEN